MKYWLVPQLLKKNWGIKESVFYLFGEPVAGYSRFVSWVKIGLIAIALLLVAILVALPFFNPAHKNYKLTFSHVETIGEDASPTMINPRFQGLDNKNQPYILSAASAEQESEEVLILDKLSANIALNSNETVTMAANGGTYFTKQELLDVLGDVVLKASQGYEVNTEAAQIDLERKEIFGSHKIIGQGPLGNIEADGFTIESEKKIIVFTGNVKVVFYPK